MVSLIGDIATVRRIFNTGATRFERGVRVALMKEAHFLRGKMVQGIARGAPGGQAFSALSPITIAMRRFKGFGGSKPLIHTGSLRSSISVVREGGGTSLGGAVFVGVHRTARSKGGKQLMNIADIHEFGRTWTMNFTPKMRRFLMMVLSKYMGGKMGRDSKGRFTKSRFKPTGGQGSRSGRITITIPARPFVRPVVDTYGQPEAVRRRFVFNLANAMGGDLGTP